MGIMNINVCKIITKIHGKMVSDIVTYEVVPCTPCTRYKYFFLTKYE